MRIFWYLPSCTYHVQLTRTVYRGLFDSSFKIVFKEPTKEKDAGQFVCTAKNESGKLTATFTVKFEG